MSGFTSYSDSSSFLGGDPKVLLLPLSSVKDREDPFPCPSARKSHRCALRALGAATTAVMTVSVLGVACQEIERSSTCLDSPGILRLQQDRSHKKTRAAQKGKEDL